MSGKAHTNGEAPERPEQRRLAPIRVVIADDSADLRALLRMQLEASAEFEVVGEASDGREALALVEEQHPDLLLLDLAMPRFDGLQALEHLQDSPTRVHVVVLSGYTGKRVDAAARDLGAVECLEKGLALSELTATLRSACGR